MYRKRKRNVSESLLLFRSEHHDHLPALELGLMFDLGDFGEFVANPVHQLHAEVLVRHFTAAETQRHLGLVAVRQERTRLRSLVWKSFSSVTGRNFTSLTWIVFCLALAS